MKLKLSLIIAMTLSVSATQAHTSGEALFKAKCSMCHIMHRPSDFSKMVAPPVMGITMHVKMAHPDKKGFKAFIKDYVIHPSKEKALCEKNTIQRFNLMPSQKDNVTPEELDKIAEYLYDNFAQKGNNMGCRGMMHKMHRGMHKDMKTYGM